LALDKSKTEKENAEKIAKIVTNEVELMIQTAVFNVDKAKQLKLKKSKENRKKMYNDRKKDRMIENAQLAVNKHVARMNNKFSPEIEKIDISDEFSTEKNIQILRIQTRVIDHITTTFLDEFTNNVIGESFPTQLGKIIKDYVQNIKRFACLETKYILHKARLYKGNESLTRLVEESGDRLRDPQNIWKPKDSILRCNKLLSGTKLESVGIFEKMMLLMETIHDNTDELTSYLRNSYKEPFNKRLQLYIDVISRNWTDSLNTTDEISGYQLLQETTTHRLWDSMLSNIQIYRMDDTHRPSTPRMIDDDGD